MANCKLAKDILKENVCGYSLLKISNLYLANHSDVTATVADGVVTAITGTFYKIEPSKDSASFTDELQVLDSGAKYRSQTLNFSVDSGSYDAELAGVIDDIALGRYVAICELANGTRVMLGRVIPLEATAANFSGAASASDSTGIEFTLQCDTTETAIPVAANIDLKHS